MARQTPSQREHAAAIRAIRKAQSYIAHECVDLIAAFGIRHEPEQDGPLPERFDAMAFFPKLPYQVAAYVDELSAASIALDRLAKRLDQKGLASWRRGEEFPAEQLFSERELGRLLEAAKARALTSMEK